MAVLTRYGATIGQAFQLADDLLDAEGDAATLGKAAGKDEAAGKATLVTLMGLEAAKARLRDLEQEAVRALTPFGDRGEMLAATADFIIRRTH